MMTMEASATSSQQRRMLLEMTESAGRTEISPEKAGGAASHVDHRRCMTTEMQTVGGVGAYLTVLNATTRTSVGMQPLEIQSFDTKKKSMGTLLGNISEKPLTSTKKS